MVNTVELIEKQIKQIPSLRELPSSEDPKFKAWQQLTKTIVIRKLSGRKWQEFQSNCDFWPNRIGPWEDDELKQALNEGLNSAQAFLETLIQEIEILGEDIEVQTKNPLPNSNNYPIMKFGEAGKNGQPGGGGSIFIQAEHFNIAGGSISADGGDHIFNNKVTINYGTINQDTAGAIKNLTELMRIIGGSQLEESQKRQLIGNAEIIKASIIQPNPDKNTLQKAWAGVQAASTISGAIQLFQILELFITPYLK